jgi:hypothetical protein
MGTGKSNGTAFNEAVGVTFPHGFDRLLVLIGVVVCFRFHS